jgi:hypothetical protein
MGGARSQGSARTASDPSAWRQRRGPAPPSDGVSRARDDGHHTSTHTLTLKETDTAFHVVDISHTKNGRPGDGFVFHGYLSSGSDRVGTIDVSCTLVFATQTYCTGMFALPGGTLAASAIVKNTATPITHVAITDGTGRYAKVRSQAVTTPTGDTTSTDVFHLTY